MKSSVMFRNHEDKVNKLFMKNQSKKQSEVELLDPLEIDLDQEEEEEESEESEEDPAARENTERIINQAIQRYTHEKKTIVFIMHTCRKLRNLAKQRDYLLEASNSLMYSGLLLLKKGIIKNEGAINSIKHKLNQLKISGFEEFLESESSQKILGELLKDNKLYYTLLSHIQKKIQTEIGMENSRASLLYNLSINTDLKAEAV